MRHSRPPVELIFLDVASLDGTAEYLAGVTAATPVRVEVVRTETDPGIPAEEGRPKKPSRIEPVGAGGLLLGGAALICASSYALGGLVIPLSALGLLLGLVGLLRVWMTGRLSPGFPITAAVTGAVG